MRSETLFDPRSAGCFHERLMLSDSEYWIGVIFTSSTIDKPNEKIRGLCWFFNSFFIYSWMCTQYRLFISNELLPMMVMPSLRNIYKGAYEIDNTEGLTGDWTRELSILNSTHSSADLEVQLVQLNHCDGVYSNYWNTLLRNLKLSPYINIYV